MDFVMHFNFATIVVADVHIFLNFSLKMKRWNENLRRNLADWPKWGEYLKRGVFLKERNTLDDYLFLKTPY